MCIHLINLGKKKSLKFTDWCKVTLKVMVKWILLHKVYVVFLDLLFIVHIGKIFKFQSNIT